MFKNTATEEEEKATDKLKQTQPQTDTGTQQLTEQQTEQQNEQTEEQERENEGEREQREEIDAELSDESDDDELLQLKAKHAHTRKQKVLVCCLFLSVCLLFCCLFCCLFACFICCVVCFNTKHTTNKHKTHSYCLVSTRDKRHFKTHILQSNRVTGKFGQMDPWRCVLCVLDDGLCFV